MVNNDIIFGPVPSRRLGQSLGINNIPPKHCSYSCIYCQLGRVGKLHITRQNFYNSVDILNAVQTKLQTLDISLVDYLAFVPDGEPTLDCNLGTTIDLLKPLGIKIAVITNASLLNDKHVQDDLAKADWVSLKMDSADPVCWRRIDHPHRQLGLNAIQQAMLDFSQKFTGTLVTETMLINGVNDHPDSLNVTADFIDQLHPHRVYLSIPTRPPANARAKPTTTEGINQAFQIFSAKLDAVECLTGYEGNAFVASDDATTDLLAITAVHPMRRDAVEALLHKNNRAWDLVSELLAQDRLVEIGYQGNTYYLRKF